MKNKKKTKKKRTIITEYQDNEVKAILHEWQENYDEEALRSNRDYYNHLTKELVTKIIAINYDLRTARNLCKEEKQKRDVLNTKVKEFKNLRENLLIAHKHSPEIFELKQAIISNAQKSQESHLNYLEKKRKAEEIRQKKIALQEKLNRNRAIADYFHKKWVDATTGEITFPYPDTNWISLRDKFISELLSLFNDPTPIQIFNFINRKTKETEKIPKENHILKLFITNLILNFSNQHNYIDWFIPCIPLPKKSYLFEKTIFYDKLMLSKKGRLFFSRNQLIFLEFHGILSMGHKIYVLFIKKNAKKHINPNKIAEMRVFFEIWYHIPVEILIVSTKNLDQSIENVTIFRVPKKWNEKILVPLITPPLDILKTFPKIRYPESIFPTIHNYYKLAFKVYSSLATQYNDPMDFWSEVKDETKKILTLPLGVIDQGIEIASTGLDFENNYYILYFKFDSMEINFTLMSVDKGFKRFFKDIPFENSSESSLKPSKISFDSYLWLEMKRIVFNRKKLSIEPKLLKYTKELIQFLNDGVPLTNLGLNASFKDYLMKLVRFHLTFRLNAPNTTKSVRTPQTILNEEEYVDDNEDEEDETDRLVDDEIDTLMDEDNFSPEEKTEIFKDAVENEFEYDADPVSSINEIQEEDEKEEEDEDEEQNDSKFCLYCGKKIPKIAKFCEFCGKEIISIESRESND
jgi:hypothetical protein